MHPPLFRPHPMCEEVVQNLVRCHDDNPFKKFLGECNEAKRMLDECFRAEKEVKLRERREEDRVRKELMERAMAATMKEMSAKSAAAGGAGAGASA